ncbi:MAG TPA: DNA polymerase III subunit gamma/tau, partial [Bacillota bacterium]|nr:DNA polymerase III subunit gamma/tau [Bacillota bacterium]
RGTGKTSTAKIFAKALNCAEPDGINPCDHCLNCTRINEGSFMDVIEIDAASNRGIDEIRDLREKVKFAPAEGKYKIYIIDEVHMMTTEAFNALLKTLEEPPKFVVFILATTEVHKLPLTIISRCQRFDFKRFTIEEITGRLAEITTAEGMAAEAAALTLVAQYAEGGMRDALSILEQTLAHCQGKLLESDVRAILGLIDREEIDKLALAVKDRDTKTALAVLDSVGMNGKDLFQFGRSLTEHFRGLLLKSLSGETVSIVFAPGELITIIETLAAATNEVKRSFQSALPLELALIKLTAIREAGGDLEARILRLEQLFQQGVVNITAQPAPPAAVTTGTASIRDSGVKSQPQSQPQPARPVPIPTPQTVVQSGQGFADWENYLEAVKARKRTVAALVQEGKPLDYSGGQLTIGFPPHLKFHLDNLALPQNRELLENIFKEQYGQTIRISCVPLTSETAPAIQAVPKAPTPDLLAKAVSIFGGEVKPISKEENKQ